MSGPVEPRAFLEANRVDDERVAVPSSNGVAHEARVRILWQRPSIHEDLPIAHILREHDDERRCLYDLLGERDEVAEARTLRKTVNDRIVELQVGLALRQDLLDDRFGVTGFRIARDPEERRAGVQA